MQAYMRSTMPFHGVAAPGVATICRALFDGWEYSTAADWATGVRALWYGARFREERYAAITLSGRRSAARFQRPTSLRLYEEMIVTGAWWDFVDELAVRRVGPLLRDSPAPISRAMRIWSRSDNLWKRRTSIICQVGSKSELDLALLYDCIEPSLESREFFLRKAIGWALRQHARVDPEEVRRYVRDRGDRLSPLSQREALRRIGSGRHG